MLPKISQKIILDIPELNDVTNVITGKASPVYDTNGKATRKQWSILFSDSNHIHRTTTLAVTCPRYTAYLRLIHLFNKIM